jgi:hypothetical protein
VQQSVEKNDINAGAVAFFYILGHFTPLEAIFSEYVETQKLRYLSLSTAGSALLNQLVYTHLTLLMYKYFSNNRQS